MNDARLGAFAAVHFAGYQPHAAGAAVAGAAVMGQVDAVAQSCVQQQLAAARQKAIAVDGNSVTSCHGPIPEGHKFPVCGWRNRAAVAAPLPMRSNPSVLKSETPTLIVDGGTAVFLSSVTIMVRQ